MKPNKFDAVLALVGGEVSNNGGEFIYHNGQKPPTEEQIQSKISELQADFDSKQYQRDRSRSYPNLQDQLDMQYWDSINGTTTWKDAIAKVKTDIPKPE